MTSTRYRYSCAGCGGTVTKPPCVKAEEQSQESKKAKGAGHGLHGWTCDTCGSGIKVKRELR